MESDTQVKTGPNGGYLEPSPNWSTDYGRMASLLEARFGLQGFHPRMGHCIISDNHGFTQVMDGKFSVVTYGNPPLEFTNSQSVADWCEKERVWFLDPHDAYKMIEDDNT